MTGTRCDGFFCDRMATHEGRWDRCGVEATVFYCARHARIAERDSRVTVRLLGGVERVDGQLVRRYREVAV